ncbi:MAG: ATP-binding protein [Rhodothermales bacterium]|nr:ATP-binding protein [Rhodothermales bacterium]
MTASRQEFERSIAALDRVFVFADTFFRSHEVGDRSAFALKLAIEEVFTNFVKYNPESPESLTIDLVQSGDDVIVRLVDPDTEPFDITDYDLADTTSDLEDRVPGGLGIYLVRKMVDDVLYEHKGRESTITLTKNMTS